MNPEDSAEASSPAKAGWVDRAIGGSTTQRVTAPLKSTHMHPWRDSCDKLTQSRPSVLSPMFSLITLRCCPIGQQNYLPITKFLLQPDRSLTKLVS
jgi:hypothetical protein